MQHWTASLLGRPSAGLSVRIVCDVGTAFDARRGLVTLLGASEQCHRIERRVELARIDTQGELVEFGADRAGLGRLAGEEQRAESVTEQFQVRGAATRVAQTHRQWTAELQRGGRIVAGESISTMLTLAASA